MIDQKLERAFVAAVFHDRSLIRKIGDLSSQDFADHEARKFWQALLAGEPIIDFPDWAPIPKDEALSAAKVIRKNSWLRKVKSWAERVKVLAERGDDNVVNVLAQSPLFPGERRGVSVVEAIHDMKTALMTDTLLWQLEGKLEPLGYLFYPGSILVIGATPGTGKSALAEQIALNLTDQGAMVLDISVELSAEVRVARYLQHLVGSGITYSKLLTKQYDPELLTKAEKLLAFTPKGSHRKLIIDPTAISMETVMVSIQAFYQQYLAVNQHNNLGPPVVIVDFLQAISVPGDGIYERLSVLAENLYGLGKSLGIAQVWLTQLKKREYTRAAPPHRADVEGSGRIEQYAHTLTLLFRPKDAAVTPHGVEVLAITPKARLGNTPALLAGVFNGHNLSFDFSITGGGHV